MSAKIIYLTAGAGGMFCGSCMHDNALAAALSKAGWDIQLVPTYTPIRTDETDVSVDQVFFGGINVFLQQKIPLLRFVPSFLDRFLDNPKLIRRVTSKAIETNPTMLGKLALSMLKGVNGNQRKEVRRLMKWLEARKPDLLVFSNILIGGAIPEIKRQQTDVKILVTLQGDDVFLDSLEDPYKSECISRIKSIAEQVDGFIVHSQFFRDYMSDYFEIDPARIHVTPLGLNVDDFHDQGNTTAERDESNRFVIGYLARLAPQKGLHCLVDAFIELHRNPEFNRIDAQLRIAGWLGPENREYADQLFKRLDEAGLSNCYEHCGSIERHEKLEFLQSLDVLSVPTEFLEPKGLYVLEAMAAGVPVVQPDHACFPELIEACVGGLLFPAGDSNLLAQAIADLANDDAMRLHLARSGRAHVHANRNAEVMAENTGEVFRELLSRPR